MCANERKLFVTAKACRAKGVEHIDRKIEKDVWGDERTLLYLPAASTTRFALLT
jgi:hypothetical protein